MSRIRCAAASLAACGAVFALAAMPASAKTTTYHFFSKGVYTRLSDSSGKPLSMGTAPAAGDRLSAGDNDYVGNHKHHAKRATASDHVVCMFTSSSTALCDGTVAIGGAMIFGDDWVLNFASISTYTVKITGGTGRYRHAHGSVTVKHVGSNSDLTIKVS